MQLSTWRPFQSIDEMFDRQSNLFNTRLANILGKDNVGITEWAPSADISETKKAFLIKAELPGVDKENIQLSIQGGYLTIEGEHHREHEEDEETFHRTESFYGKFSRSFSLPENIDQEKISASYKNGVLKVKVPKTKASKQPSSIEIKVD